MSTTQIGGALAKTVFPVLGTPGTVFIRVASAALMLLVVARPRLEHGWKRNAGIVGLFGAILGTMNLVFYLALARIPFGICVTLEFTGPLAVAVAGSRRPRDLLWVVLAAGGIVLLSPLETHDLDPIGVMLALGAGVCWASYIIVGARLGKAFDGGHGLAMAMAVAALILLPIGGGTGIGRGIHAPLALVTGCAVGLLSSALPYSLEVEALRRLPTRVFGVWMSLEPALAAVAGFLMLGERLGFHAIIALIMVTIASAGAAAFG